ncbi:MAG: hypothetical protein JXA75_06355 [Candidatus Thermoplasmatota archaeon]|nr:hypothetical protein [Candidatus Thermoplasmatota archaeon]
MKWLAVGICLLFVGLTLASTLKCQMVKASEENDFIEITTQACGIQGYTDTTVTLTRGQYHDLENYLVEFRARLNQTSTREEAGSLFREAVVKLDTYGLLPQGMSVAQAQKLVLGWYPQQITTGFFQRMSEKNQQTSQSNFLCLVAGELNNTYSIRRINNWLWEFLIRKYIETQNYFLIPFMMLFGNRHEMLNTAPLAICDIVGIGYLNMFFDTYHNSSGWFFSVGVGGIKKWTGEMVGTLPGPKIYGFIPLGGHYGYTLYADPGIWGFSGLKILPFVENKFYLGSALCVGIDAQS